MSTHGGRPESDPTPVEPDPATAPVPEPEAEAAAEPPEVEILPAPSPLERELDAARAEVAELHKKYDEAMARLRTVSKAFTDQQSEQAAFRERMEARARTEAEKRSAELVERFFDPVQNLRRSLEAAQDRSDALVTGLGMVLHQFMDVMAHLGLSEVPGVGAAFDPAVHEALAVMPVDDAAGDGRVLHVHAAGYTVKGKTLQPAQVVIGKYDAPAAEVAAEEASSETPEPIPGIEPGEA